MFIFAHLITQEGKGKGKVPGYTSQAPLLASLRRERIHRQHVGQLAEYTGRLQNWAWTTGGWAEGPVCEGHTAGAIWSAHCHWYCHLHSMALDINTTITMTTTSHVYVLSQVSTGSIQGAQSRSHIHMVAANG